MGRMNAQLVSATGHGPHFKPGYAARIGIKNAIVRDGVICAPFTMPGDAHPVPFFGLLFQEISGNTAVSLPRNACNNGPVSLFRVAMAERTRQSRRGPASFGDNQNS